MPETLRELRDALHIRDILLGQLQQVDTRLIQNEEKDPKLQNRRNGLVRRLSSSDDSISKLRTTLLEQADQARAALADAEQSLRELDERLRDGMITDAAHQKRARAFRGRINTLSAQASLLESVCSAESAPEMDRLRTEAITNSDVSVSDKTDAIMRRYTERRPIDWPGASVPERLGMVWRDGKKQRSRRSILTSAGIIGVLTLVVIGALLISGASRERDATEFLAAGEVLVPVHVEGAHAVREMTFTLAYDPNQVTGVSVIQGEVGRLAVMQYDFHRSGNLNVTIRDVVGVSGTGEMLIARFRTAEDAEGLIPLTFASIEATDARSGEDLPVSSEAGWIDAESLQVSPPTVRYITQ